MLIAEPLLSGLETLNKMVTKVFDTIRSFEAGRFVELSGSAEVKFQSSSVDVPLLGCWALDWGSGVFEGWIDEAKLNIEEGAEAGMLCC